MSPEIPALALSMIIFPVFLRSLSTKKFSSRRIEVVSIITRPNLRWYIIDIADGDLAKGWMFVPVKTRFFKIREDGALTFTLSAS
jgi:hypothetical protein